MWDQFLREFTTDWAGEDADKRQHFHPHFCGTDKRSDGVAGFFCSAPLDQHLECMAPDVISAAAYFTGLPVVDADELAEMFALREMLDGAEDALECELEARWESFCDDEDAVSVFAAVWDEDDE